MLDTMYHDNGIGLAAPQVGVLTRIITLDLSFEEIEEHKNLYPLVMINPKITTFSQEVIEAQEGCLSLPEQTINLARPEFIFVEYLDIDGKKQKLKTDGWLSRAIQHEIDHLDGKLLIDYLSNLKRDVTLRKLKKIKNKK